MCIRDSVSTLATEFDKGAKIISMADKSKRRINMFIVPVNVYHINNPENWITVYAMLDICSEGTFITFTRSRP